VWSLDGFVHWHSFSRASALFKRSSCKAMRLTSCLSWLCLQAKMTERNFHQVRREIRLMQQIK
jgi:hypothetical protein